MSERIPTPYLRLSFLSGETAEDCLRSAHGLCRRLNLGIHFLHEDREWMLQPWQSWEEVKAMMADVRHEGVTGG